MMDLYDIKRGLRAEIKKRENEQYLTFQCNVRQMCKDVLAKLEEQESEIADKDNEISKLKKQSSCTFGDDCLRVRQGARELRRQKYKRCLAMAERCKYRMYYLSSVVDYESSKLFPNPTAIKRYTKKESRMDYWKNRWLELAEQFKEGV